MNVIMALQRNAQREKPVIFGRGGMQCKNTHASGSLQAHLITFKDLFNSRILCVIRPTFSSFLITPRHKGDCLIREIGQCVTSRVEKKVS